MISQCIECSGTVRSNQHAIACDVCEEWQHRRCKTGISLKDYRAAVKESRDISFVCKYCQEFIPEREVEYEVEDNDDEDAEIYMQTTVLDDPNDVSDTRTIDSVDPSDVAMDEEDEEDDARMDVDESVCLEADDDDQFLQSTMHDVSVTAMQDVTFNLDASYSLQSDRQDNGTNIAEQSIRVDRTFTEPEVLMERSLQDVAPADITIEDEPLHYELIPSASQKGKDLLVDSTGYTYVVKERRRATTKWRCSVRNKAVSCPAGVSEKAGTFQANAKEHVHPPDPNRGLTAKVAKKAKATASDDVFKSARVIVVDSKKDVQGIVAVGRVNDAYVTRTVNRHRQQLRPEEPIDMDFEVMRKPFDMLLSIHGFVRRGEYSKQIPLLYAIMSGRKTSDYTTVFKAILRGLQGEQCVAEVVCDFEVALWKGVRRVFDGVSVRGCVFHWGQAVWRHVQSLGLATQYMQNEGTYCYIRKLLCLPFLPEEHIVPTFYALKDLNSCAGITPLLDYIERTWLQSTTWEVENWCIFGQSVRTNNDCEGWHRKLNTRAGAAPPFYSLVTVLHHEAAEASTQVQLVSEMALRRMQRRAYRTMQSLIFQAWDSYRDGNLTATGLLKKISTVYKPRVARHEL